MIRIRDHILGTSLDGSFNILWPCSKKISEVTLPKVWANSVSCLALGMHPSLSILDCLALGMLKYTSLSILGSLALGVLNTPHLACRVV